MIGPEDLWPFSVMIFVCMMVDKSSEKDIQRILEQLEEG